MGTMKTTVNPGSPAAFDIDTDHVLGMTLGDWEGAHFSAVTVQVSSFISGGGNLVGLRTEWPIAGGGVNSKQTIKGSGESLLTYGWHHRAAYLNQALDGPPLP